MPSYMNAGSIAAYVQTIYEAATLVARDRQFLPGLVTPFTDARGTATRSRSEYGTVTFGTVNDYDDLSSQAITPAVKNSLTPLLYAAQFIITQLRIDTDPFNVMRDAARELGEGAAQSIQQNIAACFTNLTAGTVGTAGGTLKISDLAKAVAILRQAGAQPPYYGVLQNGQAYHLGTALLPGSGVSITNAPELQNRYAQEAFVGYALGVYWFQTNDIPSGTAAVAGIFNREAIAYDVRAPFTIKPQYDASRGMGAIELNASMVYATGVWRPGFGVKLVGTSVVA